MTFVPPMLAELAKTPPGGEGWVYERKLDGLRCVATRTGDEVHLWSRNHLSFDKRFPEIIAALRRLPATSFVLDGEIVAFEGDKDSFAALQQRGADTRPVFAVFDLIELLGKQTTGIPLTERKALLEKVLTGDQLLVPVPHLTGDPQALVDQACRDGWEGLIAKRADGPYKQGRSKDWLKLKCSASQELVIAGWTPPQGARTGFGALLVGYYEGDALRYAGKVGTGFDTKVLHSLHAELVARQIPTSPFADVVKEKGAQWARPELVANFSFTEWTRDGKLRHPVFQGLRPDKSSGTVTREASSST